MTIKPKASKYRIRRGAAASGQPSEAQPDTSATPQDAPKQDAAPKAAAPTSNDGQMPLKRRRVTSAKTGEVTSGKEVKSENDIDAIRKEGLTGRQLRMARRVAQKHGLPATSDFDAVRLLRAQGIDPFQKSNMLDLVQPAGEKTPAVLGDENQLPQTFTPPPPSNTPEAELGDRAAEIMKIQRDISRRRRVRLMLLLVRLAVFVMIPTMIAGYYYHFIATPMFATKSEFQITQATPPSASAASSSLLGSSPLATALDSITVQGYMDSLAAMIRLDEEHQFKEHFSDPSIDPLQRLDADASNKQAHKIYAKRVLISYDPTEGIMKMEVVARDPETSELFSKALISYAEEQVANLTRRVREDTMRDAQDSVDLAEEEMNAASAALSALQERYNSAGSEEEKSILVAQISALEGTRNETRLAIADLETNARPNAARMDALKRRLTGVETQLAELRSNLTQQDENGRSVNAVSAELALAQVKLETRIAQFQLALQSMETARVEASRQTRYLSIGVPPTPPDEATYPRAFENTLVAFFIFIGIYLMASLTASILREQITS